MILYQLPVLNGLSSSLCTSPFPVTYRGSALLPRKAKARQMINITTSIKQHNSAQELKTFPMPTAAPANAIVAQPAPINFAPSNMLNFDVGEFLKTMTFD